MHQQSRWGTLARDGEAAEGRRIAMGDDHRPAQIFLGKRTQYGAQQERRGFDREDVEEVLVDRIAADRYEDDDRQKEYALGYRPRLSNAARFLSTCASAQCCL